MKIYVASSWRNIVQPAIVNVLRQCGHEVYDFKNPKPGDKGFGWSGIDPDWQAWTPQRYRECLNHPLADSGFANDFDAMKWADACVLVLPCGRSAHLEAGWFTGAGKPVWFFTLDRVEPELMYRLAGRDRLLCSMDELFNTFGEPNHA